MSDGDSSSSSMINRTYENDVVTDSLIPLLDTTLEEVKKLFAEAKQKTAYANNILQYQQRNDDYKVENVIIFDGQWNRNSPEQMREMAQLYFDQATIAKREAALNAERNLNLQSRLSSSELANKRLLDALEGLEPTLIELLKTAAENEMTRIDATQRFKNIHDSLEYEKKTLTKELAKAQKDCNDFASNCRKLQYELNQKSSEMDRIKDRANITEKELDLLKTKLDEAVKNARETQTLLTKAQRQIDTLQDSLDAEKKKSQQKSEYHQRECEKLAYEKDMALDRQKKAFEKDAALFRSDYEKSIQQHKKNAQEAIARASKETQDAIDSQQKYYKLYTDLHANLEAYKKDFEHKIQARLLNGYRNMANDFNQEQVKNIRAQNNIRPIRIPTATNKFSEK
jgi:hypothetical protein